MPIYADLLPDACHPPNLRKSAFAPARRAGPPGPGSTAAQYNYISPEVKIRIACFLSLSGRGGVRVKQACERQENEYKRPTHIGRGARQGGTTGLARCPNRPHLTSVRADLLAQGGGLSGLLVHPGAGPPPPALQRCTPPHLGAGHLKGENRLDPCFGKLPACLLDDPGCPNLTSFPKQFPPSHHFERLASDLLPDERRFPGIGR